MLNDDCDHEMSRLSACLTPRVLHCPVVELYGLIEKFLGSFGLEEGSKFKSNIVWDLPCCPIHL